MNESRELGCSECEGRFESLEPMNRRRFLRTAAGAALGAGAATTPLRALADAPPAAKPPRPAENLVRELFATLTAEQRQNIVRPYNHGAGADRKPTRLGIYNSAIEGKRIGQNY